MDLMKYMSDSGLNEYSKVLKSVGDQKQYLLFIEEKNQRLVMHLSDGQNHWTSTLALDVEIAEFQRNMKLSDIFGVFTLIKHNIDREEVEVNPDSTRLSVTIKVGRHPRPVITVQLSRETDTNDISNLMFRLAHLLSASRREIVDLQASVSRLERERSAGPLSAMMDQSKGATTKRPTRAGAAQAGMSLVNPANRKRKKAKGVVYDADE